jgi:HEAT repeats
LEDANTIQAPRPKKRILILLAACVLLALGLSALWLQDKEPEYHGRNLSEWMVLARPDDPRNQQQIAGEAIEHIGTNGLPWFAKWMTYNTPKWKRAFLRSKYAKTAPKTVIRVIIKPIIRADQSRAQMLFLGSPSVPYLIPVMDRYPADCSKAAISMLGQIAESALPPLLEVATNRAKPTEFRRMVLDTMSFANQPRPMPLKRSPQNRPIWPGSLPYIPEDPNYSSSLIPILMPCLHEKGLEDSTIRLLGRLGLTADTSFQVFTNGITAKNVDVRIAAVRWAALFKSNSPRSTPELIKCFNDPDPAVRKEATNALQKIAPEFAPSASH